MEGYTVGVGFHQWGFSSMARMSDSKPDDGCSSQSTPARNIN